MLLKVLGSSSHGNCYILESANEALILECGVRFEEVKKALDFNLNKVVGCLITHEHKDHCKAVQNFLKARIPVFASAGTIREVEPKGYFLPLIIEAGVAFKVGSFKILPFDVKHDCAEPLGFMIRHEEAGTILFATDTYYLPHTFQGLNNILIECNYSNEILERNIQKGLVPQVVRTRTIESHMSFETCRDALLANDLSAVNNIVLLHLSDGNSDAQAFKEGIFQATAKRVHVADKGMKLNFNKTPF